MRAGQGTVQLLGGTGLRSIPSGFVPTIAPRGGLSAAHKPPLQQGYPLSPAIAGFVGIPLDARKQRLFAGQFIRVRHHTPPQRFTVRLGLLSPGRRLLEGRAPKVWRAEPASPRVGTVLRRVPGRPPRGGTRLYALNMGQMRGS